ncbi:Uma2 family endonuclease [Hymenobacter rubidus]|uniref:Uma2 family endonuclease n=1 Tax=Hymenobacter rubidus TaxID=1441626 RepID=UPI00191DCB0B|nr:Uma2 family endonuclease [Hymenobacter rubidus]
METQAVEIIENEVVLEEARSLNHSRLIHRISMALLPYEEQYDILPELEFELSAGRLKPDVALLPRQQYDYRRDVLRVVQPPVTAIEILSPTQSFDYLVGKIQDEYLTSGVQSAWLVLPRVGNIYLFLPGQPPQVFTSGLLRDPATQIEINLDTLFR